ncbi:MAG: hypothetical protein VW982_03620 [Candidatus Poseidoniales archaeon]|jgi:hypothetical protein
MVTIQHGDLIEQRRGGVDVLRILVQNLAVHEQSGAVFLRSSSNEHRQGWLLFRLGQPVMAFHQGESEQEGLEALLSIEEDALDVGNELMLYELTMNALRTTMTAHPGSVLHLEHQTQANAGASWWSSVRLPSSSWRRAARLEDIEALALDTEHRRRNPLIETEHHPVLEPGRIYLFDSPDPHPMIQIGVELAERGMPLLGLFGLPHAETEATRRLPQPQSYALLSPHGGYEVLQEQDALRAVVNAFQWGNERSVILFDGLDRLGNAFGDNGMLDVFRSICDGVRFNDHIALVTTDLEVFETTVHHTLVSEATVLRNATVSSWIDDPDALWDHPVLLAPDEEEEEWLAAQIRHQGAKVGGPTPHPDVLEGGSQVVDEEDRIEATQALSEVVESWPETHAQEHSTQEDVVSEAVSVGTTAWRPVADPPIIHGRYVSESPRATEVEEPSLPLPPSRRKRNTRSTTVAESEPTLRPPQRLPKRKAPPRLPNISQGLTSERSSAVVNSASPLPDWPVKASTQQAYRKENMDVFSHKQVQALERQEKMVTPLTTKALKDSVSASPDIESAQLPPPAVPKTVELPSSTERKPLTNSLRPVTDGAKDSREASSKEQALVDIDEAYERWSTFEEPDGMDATALYNEHGEALNRYSGDAS